MADTAGRKGRVLVITQAFPPRSDVSVQRIYYLVRDLAELGYETIVLTEQTDEVVNADLVAALPSSCPKTRPAPSRRFSIVIVQDSADSLAASGRSVGRRSVLRCDDRARESLMMAFPVVWSTYSMIACRRCRSPSGTILSRHSDLIESTNRSA